METTAGHELSHKQCRSVTRWSSGYAYISRVKGPQNERKGRFEESRQAQADTRPLRHKADRLVTGGLKLCSVVVRHGFVYASAASVGVRQT